MQSNVRPTGKDAEKLLTNATDHSLSMQTPKHREAYLGVFAISITAYRLRVSINRSDSVMRYFANNS